MNSKTYTLPNGKKAVFEYDVCGIGKVTLECMDELMAMITDRPQGEWIYGEHDVAMCDGYRCDKCGFFVPWDYEHKFIDFINDYHFCPNCGARMRPRLQGKHFDSIIIDESAMKGADDD